MKPATLLPLSLLPGRPVAPGSTPSYYELLKEEQLQAHTIAETIASVRFALPLDRLSQADRLECEYAAVYALRRPHLAWQIQAAQDADRVIQAGLLYEIGAPFTGMSEARRAVISQKVREYAWAAFLGTLEGCGMTMPGTFLRIRAAIVESEAGQ